MSDDDGKNLQSVVTIAQTLLLKAKESSVITPTLIEEKVAVAAALVVADGVVDTTAATGELIRRFSHWIGQDSSLIDDVGHVAWLAAGLALLAEVSGLAGKEDVRLRGRRPRQIHGHDP